MLSLACVEVLQYVTLEEFGQSARRTSLALGSSSRPAMGSFEQSCLGYSHLLPLILAILCMSGVRTVRTTGNWLRALSSWFGLGLFKVLFFCSSQMKFLGLCRSPGIKVKEGHCGSGRKWWYLKLVLPMRTQAVSPVSQREITGLTAIFC